VRVPLAELAISNGLFPGLAGVVKTLAGELGPAGIRVNGVLPVRIATDRVRELDALRGDPDEVRARNDRRRRMVPWYHIFGRKVDHEP
jgi:3-oxoacyl-[acyl-carrier protein] reductase